jgi:hypothetical protein
MRPPNNAVTNTKQNISSQRETEEKARQPETKLGAIAPSFVHTSHKAKLRTAKRSRTIHPKPTHGTRDKPKLLQPGARRDRASGPATSTRRDVRARPTQGRAAAAKGNVQPPQNTHTYIMSHKETEEKARQSETPETQRRVAPAKGNAKLPERTNVCMFGGGDDTHGGDVREEGVLRLIFMSCLCGLRMVQNWCASQGGLKGT